MVAGAPLSQISLGSSDDTSTDTRPHSPAGGRAWLGYGSQQLKETRARYIPGCGRSRKPHFNARARRRAIGRHFPGVFRILWKTYDKPEPNLIHYWVNIRASKYVMIGLLGLTDPASLSGTTKVRVLLADLVRCQDAPEVSALAVPALRVLGRRRRIRVMTLKAMTLSPGLNAVFRRLGLNDPAAFGAHRSIVARSARSRSRLPLLASANHAPARVADEVLWSHMSCQSTSQPG